MNKNDLELAVPQLLSEWFADNSVLSIISTLDADANHKWKVSTTLPVDFSKDTKEVLYSTLEEFHSVMAFLELNYIEWQKSCGKIVAVDSFLDMPKKKAVFISSSCWRDLISNNDIILALDFSPSKIQKELLRGVVGRFDKLEMPVVTDAFRHPLGKVLTNEKLVADDSSFYFSAKMENDKVNISLKF